MATGQPRRTRRRTPTGSADTRAEVARLKKVKAAKATAQPKATPKSAAASTSPSKPTGVSAADRAKYAKRRYRIAKTWEQDTALEKQRRSAPKSKAGPTQRHSAAASQASLRLAPKKTAKKPATKKAGFKFRKKG